IVRYAVPQLVADLHVLLAAIVALIVLKLRQAEGAVLSPQMAGDDVPAHPAVRQIVERRERTDERVGMMWTGRNGRGETQVHRCRADDAQQRNGIVRRPADAVSQRLVQSILVPIEYARRVGKEYGIKST